MTRVTVTFRGPPGVVASTTSPTRTGADGLARAPFTCTRPPLQAVVAAERDANSRTDHTHTSARTEVEASVPGEVGVWSTRRGYRWHSGAMGAVEDVEISGDMIRLGQLLKFANVAESGSDAGALVAGGDVLVNGEVEQRRGRQLHRGDLVEVLTPADRVGLRVV